MATLQMKIDSVHAEFLSGNAVSSTVTYNSVVSRDSDGGIWANKLTSVNLGLTHNVPTTDRTEDTVFYSSNADTIYKNTTGGFKTSLGLNNVINTGATVAATPNKIVLRDSEGDIFASNVHVSHIREIRNSDNVFYSSDGDTVYKNTADGLKASLGLNNVTNMEATGAATPNKIVLRNLYGDIFASNVHADGSGYYHNLRALSNVYGQKFVSFGDDDTMMEFPIADTITMTTGGTERLRIKNNGNVGIGTASPGYKLHVDGSSMFTNTVNITNNDANAYASLEMGGTLGAYIDLKSPSSDDYDFRLITTGSGGSIQVAGGSNGMTFNSSGYVGIGTNNPGTPLEVDGISVFKDYIHMHRSSSQRNYPHSTGIDVYNSGSGDSTLLLRVQGSSGGDPFISFDVPNAYGWSMGVDNSDSYKFKLARHWAYVDSSTALTVTTSDYVGIGTSSPSERLHVYRSGTARMMIQNGGSSGECGLTLKGYHSSSGTTEWQIYQKIEAYPRLRIWRGSDNGYFQWSGSNNVLNFTGQHRTFIKDVPFTEAPDLEGLIVSADQNKYIKMNGGVEAGSNAITINESLPVVSLSNVATDKKCFGVISASEDPDTREDAYGNFVSVFKKELGDTRVYINSVGEGAIWVTNINGNIESGDYITTSNVAGYGMKQDSEFLANYTVAKITMDCDFSPATQPVQIIKKELGNVNYWVETTYTDVALEEYSNLTEENRQTVTTTQYSNDEGNISVAEYSNLESNVQATYSEIETVTYQKTERTESATEREGWTLEVREELVNVLDEHGQLKWEDHPTKTEKAYKIRYLTADGQVTDEANAIHIAAFVGCTYHCG